MLAHYAMFAGWMGWGWMYEGRFDPEVGIPFMVVVLIHWYVMGMFMTCEAADLSPRVKRDLPQSFLGRVFLTWLNPGSGTGYVFASINLIGAAILTGAALYWAQQYVAGLAATNRGPMAPRGVFPWNAREFDGAINLAIVAPCYLIIYLGVGRMAIHFLRRFGDVNMFVGVVFHLGLLAAGNLGPLLVQFAIGMFEGYGFWRSSWTQAGLARGGRADLRAQPARHSPRDSATAGCQAEARGGRRPGAQPTAGSATDKPLGVSRSSRQTSNIQRRTSNIE
jgi:hypothetical protein